MAAVLAQVAEGKKSLSEKILVRSEDIVQGDGILRNLTPGLEWTVHDLITLMIIESDNMATNLLIDLVGVENIQLYMTVWGFKQSHFRHKLQIKPFRKENESNVVTAKEMTHFLKGIATGNLVSMSACRKMIEIMKKQKMNGLLPGLLPDQSGLIGMIPNWEMAHKTGYVPGIEHNVGLFYLPGHTFAVSVLSKNLPSREEPKRIMGEMGAMIFEKVLYSNIYR